MDKVEQLTLDGNLMPYGNQAKQYTLTGDGSYGVDLTTISVCPDPGREKMQDLITEFFDRVLQRVQEETDEGDVVTYNDLYVEDGISVNEFMDFLQEKGINSDWYDCEEIIFAPKGGI